MLKHKISLPEQDQLDMIFNHLEETNDLVFDMVLGCIAINYIGDKIHKKHEDYYNIDHSLVSAYMLTHYQFTKDRQMGLRVLHNKLDIINKNYVFDQKVVSKCGKTIKELYLNVRKLTDYLEDGKCKKEIDQDMILIKEVIKDHHL